MLKHVVIAAGFATFGVAPAAAEWVTKPSDAGVVETADRLEAAIENGPPTLFARIDHAEGAASVDMDLPGATLMIFGNPQIGTPVMQQNIRAALDFPIHVLVFEEDGTTMVGYETPETLRTRYDIAGAEESLRAMGNALDTLTDAAVSAQ